jgi:hypothetical protein
MGMDLWGRTRGTFDVNWTGWHPLVRFIKTVAADEAAPCSDWDSNDCPGLDAEASAKLAAKLKAERDRGALDNFDVSPELVDRFIAFLETSGGWAAMETWQGQGDLAGKEGL